jgi:uncharacterized ferredoxin-like protein
MTTSYFEAAKYIALNLARAHDHAEAVILIEKTLSKMTNECDLCGLKVCSRCEKVRYCSRDCQVKDYKKHKKECIQSSHDNK